MLFHHFASSVGRRCEFYVGTLHCNFIHNEFWPHLNFQLEQQIELILKLSNLLMVSQEFALVSGRGRAIRTFMLQNFDGFQVQNECSQFHK